MFVWEGKYYVDRGLVLIGSCRSMGLRFLKYR